MIDWSEEDMRVSRTELKKAHERLQQLSIPLANLSKKQLKALPASDYFMAELMALADITSANARNRQTKRVGKLMTKGMGETDPIADNTTDQCRFRNRRIEFVVYDETTPANDGLAINSDALDPDLNPLDSDNDDLMPDADDTSRGTALDPAATN